jgi:hypothetical protein
MRMLSSETYAVPCNFLDPKGKSLLQRGFHITTSEARSMKRQTKKLAREGMRRNAERLSPPPPAVVLRCELEVRQPDRDERRDDDEDDKHDEQDAINRVDLVAPHAGEDVVQLDVDGAERQEPGHDGLRDDMAVPGQGGDLPRELAGVARGRKVGGGVVLARDAAHDLEVRDAASKGQVYRGRMQTRLQ